MKKIISIFLSCLMILAVALPVSAASTMNLEQAYAGMKPALILLLCILAVLLLTCIIFTALTMKKKRVSSSQRLLLILIYIVTVLVLVCVIFCYTRYVSAGRQLSDDDTQPVVSTQDTEAPASEETQESTEETTEPPTEPIPTFNPESSELSNPENWGVKWEIITQGAIVESYNRTDPISFGAAEDYFSLPGIATFRGNNYRNAPTYGTANVTDGTLSKIWGRDIGSLNGWPGSGWTGQPLMVQWDNETKAIMNMYADKKAKEDLVEVIYATLDGNIYFYDLEDGSYTRDPLYVGMNFKGAGSLDPRGYPIMYVGSGDYFNGSAPRLYIISLIDGKVLFERSGNDAFSTRDWVAFDSSPLVDAETDTLIWPGESGVLYTIKLNTAYDKAAGTLEIAPEEIVKTRYSTSRSGSGAYWIGYEPSAVIVDRYLYISENGGMFFCIDLNTMELVWSQDTRDDSNSTPVFEWNGTDGGYIYTAPSLHWTNSGGAGYICIYKLDAKTGEIVWEKRYDCYTVDGVSGGVQSTPLLGKPGTQLEGLIIYTIARTPNIGDGKLVAFDTQSGEVVWEYAMDYYSWSSPVPVYNEDGTAHIVVCDSVGYMKLFNAKGEVVSTLELGSNIEASPAVFNDILVVGTRGQQIFGVRIQ